MSRMTSAMPAEPAAHPEAPINDVPHDLQEAAAHLGHAMKQMAGSARQTCRDLAHSARRSIEHGRTRSILYERQVEEFVRARPITSIAIAVAAGALVGMLWRRR